MPRRLPVPAGTRRAPSTNLQEGSVPGPAGDQEAAGSLHRGWTSPRRRDDYNHRWWWWCGWWWASILPCLLACHWLASSSDRGRMEARKLVVLRLVTHSTQEGILIDETVSTPPRSTAALNHRCQRQNRVWHKCNIEVQNRPDPWI